MCFVRFIVYFVSYYLPCLLYIFIYYISRFCLYLVFHMFHRLPCFSPYLNGFECAKVSTKQKSSSFHLYQKTDATALLQLLLLQGKNVNNVVYYATACSSCLVTFVSYPILVEYPPHDQIWIVFGNLYLCQYL